MVKLEKETIAALDATKASRIKLMKAIKSLNERLGIKRGKQVSDKETANKVA